jgi:hypothetical protein
MIYTEKTRRKVKRSKNRYDLCAWNHRTVYNKPKMETENA